MDKRHNYRQKPKREEVVDNYTPSGKETDLIRPIEELGLPEPIFVALKAGKFETISDLAKRRVTQMYKVQNIGKKQCWEITKRLSKFAIAFRPEDVVADTVALAQGADKLTTTASASNADSRVSGSQQGKQAPVGNDGDNANSVAPVRATRQSRFEERNKNRDARNNNQNPNVRFAPNANGQTTSVQNANAQNGSSAVAGQNGNNGGRFASSGNNQNANNQNGNNPNGNQGGRFAPSGNNQNANNRNGSLGNRNFPNGNNQGGNQGARFGQNNGQNNFNKNNNNNNSQRNAQPQCKIPFKNPEQRNAFFNSNKGLNDSLTRQYQGYTISQIIMGKRQRPLPSAPMREVLTPQSVVKFCRKGKWGYKDWKGNVLIQPIFDEAFSFNEGLACVEKNSKLGFIDLKGDTIVDFVYDSATSFSDGIASVTKDEKSGYIDKEGKVVIPFIYEIATQFVENRAIVFNDGRWGVLAKNGEVMWR